MSLISYRYYIFEAIKITSFCLFVTGIFKYSGASNNTTLIVFNMAVMSAAATFSSSKKSISHTVLGSALMALSIVLGGVFGFYAPTLSKLATIIFAGLAFLLPKTKSNTNIFVTSTVMFLIFSSLPFNLHRGLYYLFDGVIVVAIFTLFTWFANLKIHPQKQTNEDDRSEGNMINALITVTALFISWVISHFLKSYTTLSHLYWVGLTVLVVIQGAKQKNIKTAIKRIVVNLCGAILIVLLYDYLIPNYFWIIFSMLIFFLFMIFALGFSYTARTLFIEMFVLGFTYLLGSYHNIIAVDRVVLTSIGGLIVIGTTLLFYSAFSKLTTFNSNSHLK